MADRSHDGAERDAEDTHELPYTEQNENNSAFGLDQSHLQRDHCDLLLDAIDAQLGQLQVRPQKHQTITRECDHNVSALPLWSQSPSKDTGLGNTTETNDTPMSYLDFIHTSTVEDKSEWSTCCPEAPVMHKETKKRFDRGTRDKEEIESQREQVIWRLERLLGDACKGNGIAGETQPPSDSICTEDFVKRFSEEMVELAFSESNMQQLHIEEEAQRTEISNSDTCQNKQKGESVLNIKRRRSATTWKSSQATMIAHYSQSSKPCQRRELKKCLSESYGVNMSHGSEKLRPEQQYKAPQRVDDNGSISHETEGVTEHENLQHNNSHSSKTRCLAEVPVRSFDTVSIDSELDLVRREQVRQHIHSQPGWCALIQSVRGVDDYYTNQSDYDTPTQRETVPKAQCIKKETCRLEYTYEDNDKDTDEEIHHWSSRCRTKRKMQSDWVKMKQRLSNLRQKCEKEEETLRLKRTQLKDVELCLSELQQKKKHALQELEWLAAETTKMEEEKRPVECVLSDSRVERDSLSFYLEKLQKQRESCVLEVRDMEKELVTVSQRKQTLTDRSCMERKSIIMSVLEKEEMERQLNNAKSELFAEQRRAREKLESMRETLEETCEELQRATEAESSLRNKCSCLEEKQMQKKKQIEVLESRVRELQVELGECKMRVGTLEKMLCQKELQLIDFQGHHGALQAERDGLKDELQHLKTQHYKTLKEAQEQAHRMMVNRQVEEEKVSALKEQDLSLTQHIKSMQSSIQLKEEEAKQLRKSLEEQREEAKNHKEELQVEALKKVHKAILEERRRWEAEKVEAVQVHCEILEEQNRENLEIMKSEMQEEKSKALAIQHEVLELKTKVQELEKEHCAQQTKQESLLDVICKSLKEEHQAKLQRLQKQMEQESQRTVLRLEQGIQLAEKEADRLRVMLEERESSHNQITAELDQQLRNWAQELGTECQHLYLLVEKCGAKQSAMQLSPSPSVPEALTNLRTLREQLKHSISHLEHKLDSQKQTTEQLRKDKEWELSTQRQQLRMERDQAMDFLKERLIQEHIEELSSLNWVYMSDGGADKGGVAACLRKQLKAKDLELRQVQRNMSQWKEQTGAHLACKFEEELTADLERKASKSQQERESKGPEGEMTLHAKQEAQNLFCIPSRHAVDSAASYSPSEMASFKLLCYLQSRVKQLRVEHQAYTWSLSPPDTVPLNLSGSCLTTITQGQNSAGIPCQSSTRTVSS